MEFLNLIKERRQRDAQRARECLLLGNEKCELRMPVFSNNSFGPVYYGYTARNHYLGLFRHY